MLITESVAIKELQWEYSYSLDTATQLVSAYVSQGKYQDLCDLLQAKRSIEQIGGI